MNLGKYFKNKSLIYLLLLFALLGIFYYLQKELYFQKNRIVNIPVETEVEKKDRSALIRRDSTSDWQTYKNTAVKYSIKFPLDWKISESSFEPIGSSVKEDSLKVDIYPGDADKDFLEKLTIECFPDLISGAGDIETGNTIFETMTNNYKSWELEDKVIKDRKIGGVDALYIEGNLRKAGVMHNSKVYLVKVLNGNGACAFIVRDFFMGLPIYDQILSTLSFDLSK